MTEMAWGSDAIAQLLRDLKLDYAAIVPGSSFRGLHDSFVNYLEARDPKLLVCLHEEHTVAIAHGYAKVTGKPMLARLYRPRGRGPFPAIVDVHGGAWVNGDRLNNAAIDEALKA